MAEWLDVGAVDVEDHMDLARRMRHERGGQLRSVLAGRVLAVIGIGFGLFVPVRTAREQQDANEKGALHASFANKVAAAAGAIGRCQ